MNAVNFFETYGDMISTGVLIVTLIALIFYTFATFGLKKATVKQNELRLRPCIIIEKVTDGLDFHNIGHSPGLNVNIETLETENFKVLFTPHNLIKHGQRIRINYKYEGKDADTKQAFSPDVDILFVPEAFTKDEYILKVTYENMENVKYYTKIRVIISQEKTEFIKTSKL